MKFQAFVLPGLTAIVAAGVISVLPQNVSAQNASTQNTGTFSLSRNSVVQTLAAAPKLLKSGNFVNSAKSAEGEAKIVTENGKRYLELSGNFKTSNGPDLRILLHKSGNPSNYSQENYVSLGRLDSVAGNQRYEIPANVNLDEFKSAVIWCRAFNVTFGFAALG